MSKLLFEEEVYEIVGAAMTVHRELGPGFLEAVYQEAFEIELRGKGIEFQSQMPVRITYKGELLRKGYVADLFCHNNIIVELKALYQMSGTEESQLLNYLKATGCRLGLLVNFGTPSLQWKRMIL